MGEVWSAVHAFRATRAAVKLLPSRHAPHAVEALQREARLIARLDHPNIVGLYDLGEDGRPWLAMELAEGPLQAPTDWDGLRSILLDVLAGLGAAHAAGILHLDLKPNNVLRAGGRHLLADFGISHGLSSEDPTRLWGSPAYLAPEGFDGRPEVLCRATDLYSLGCLAWTLASGRPPFDGPPDALATAHHHRSPPVLVPRLPVPEGFEDLLRELLAKHPGDRPSSAAAVIAALEALPAPLVSPARPSCPLELPPTRTLQLDRTFVPQAPPSTRARSLRRAAPLPDRWPRTELADGWRRGTGLLGLRPVPWKDREVAQDRLWTHLRRLEEGRPGLVTLGGCPGAGRSRLLRRLLAEAHHRLGAETLLVDGDLGETIGRRFAGAPHLALQLDLPADLASRLVSERLTDPDNVLRRLVTACPRPFVIGVEPGSSVPADLPALVVQVVDGPADIELAPFPPLVCQALIASWTGLDAHAVAAVVHATGGDLQASVQAVLLGVEQGVLRLGDQGWELVEPDALRIPRALIERWRPLVAPLGSVDRDVLADLAVRPQPYLPAPTATEERMLQTLAAHGLVTGDRWTSSVGRQALLEHLGDVRSAHRRMASRSAPWEAGEHLLEAGDLREAAGPLVHNAWRLAARGQMARVESVLRRLEPWVQGLPTDDALRGHLEVARARLGGTHLGYDNSLGHGRRALVLAEQNGFAGEWRQVGRVAAGHLLHLGDVRRHPAGTEEAERVYARLESNSHLQDLRAWLAIRRGDPWTAMRHALRGCELAAPPPDPDHTHLRVALTFWVAAGHAGVPGAREGYRRLGDAFLQAGYLSAEMDVMAFKADLARWDGDPKGARTLYAEALAIASRGEARADVGPFLGAALAELDLGEVGRARDLLGAARSQLGDTGPTWEALITLFGARADLLDGRPLAIPDLELALQTLEQTGYLDTDILDTLACLDAPELREQTQAFRARRAAYASAESSRPPLVHPAPPLA